MYKARGSDEYKEDITKEPAQITRVPEIKETSIKFRVRFDYKGYPRPPKFFFGGKKTMEIAKKIRDQQLTLWENIPLQGVNILQSEPGELYSVYSEEEDEEISYAPLELEACADSLEDMIRFVVAEEFRKLKIIEPENIILDQQAIEKLFFKVNDACRKEIYLKSKKGRD